MPPNGNSPGSKARSGIGSHEEFVELCAVSTTGELSEDEQRRLSEHLEICADCREALSEFEAVANTGIPLLSPELAGFDAQHKAAATVPIASTKPAATKGDFNGLTSQRGERAEPIKSGVFRDGNGNRRAVANWNQVWLSLAAAVLLIAALGLFSYRAEKRQAPAVKQASTSGDQAKVDTLEQQLSDAGHERVVLSAQVMAKDRQIADLQRQIQNEASALSAAKAQQANLEQSLENAQNENQEIAQQQASTGQRLTAAQASLEKMQSELDSVRQQRSQDEVQAASLQTRIGDLKTALTASQRTANQQQDLLSEDADIRDLMGARELYIAEVYDVGRDGATEKPYGRIFYTKGKSLIFYAYDLDQQPGAKPASTFQAWGQSGPDKQEALNLGVFYQDSVAKRRWVLKFDNAQALEQINAVFVTVEPRGGSQTPSGKRLLFASLKIEPNHP